MRWAIRFGAILSGWGWVSGGFDVASYLPTTYMQVLAVSAFCVCAFIVVYGAIRFTA